MDNNLVLSTEETLEVIDKVNRGDDEGALRQVGLAVKSAPTEDGDILTKASQMESGKNKDTKEILVKRSAITMSIVAAITSAIGYFKFFGKKSESAPAMLSGEERDYELNRKYEKRVKLEGEELDNDMHLKNPIVRPGLEGEERDYDMNFGATGSVNKGWMARLSEMISSLKNFVGDAFGSVRGVFKDFGYVRATIVASVGAFLLYVVYKIWSTWGSKDDENVDVATVPASVEVIEESFAAVHKLSSNFILNEADVEDTPRNVTPSAENVNAPNKISAFISTSLTGISSLWKNSPKFRGSMYASAAVAGIGMVAVFYNKLMSDMSEESDVPSDEMPMPASIESEEGSEPTGEESI